MRIREKIIQKFYLSRLGGLYLELVCWWDDKFNKDEISSIYETRQIERKTEVMAYKRGIKLLREKVNSFVNVRNKKDFHTKLQNVDLIKLAEEKKESTRIQFLKEQSSGTKKTKDIENAVDRTRMIDKRINDFKELQVYNKERTLIKEIKKQRKEGNESLAVKLEQEWKQKYGNKKN